MLVSKASGDQVEKKRRRKQGDPEENIKGSFGFSIQVKAMKSFLCIKQYPSRI